MRLHGCLQLSAQKVSRGGCSQPLQPGVGREQVIERVSHGFCHPGICGNARLSPGGDGAISEWLLTLADLLGHVRVHEFCVEGCSKSRF